jgi:hypothetical protein
VEDIFTIPFVTLVLSMALAIFGYVGTSNSENHIVQQSANAAARVASQDPNPADAVNAAVQALQAGGLPTAWNGQSVIDPNKVQIGSADSGQLITTTISVNAPVAFPGLLRFLGVSSGPTQTVTRTGEYANEWGTTSNAAISSIPTSGGSEGSGGVTTSPYSVSLAVNPVGSTFLDGTTVALTATANQDVSLSGDALQILDESTGQWMGLPLYQGTINTVDVSGAGESDTYVAYISPFGETANALAQSNPETVSWKDASNFSNNLSITATAPNGAVWDYHSNQANGGYPDLFAGVPITLNAKLQGVSVPPYASLSIKDLTTGQVLGSALGVNSLSANTSSINSTHYFASVLTDNGQTISTDSSGQDVEAIWLNTWSVGLTEAVNSSNHTVSFTGTVNYPLQSGTMNGSFQYWMYLYNQSLGQWIAPQAITGNTSQYTWSGISGVNGDTFVVYVEPASSSVAGNYPASSNLPPIESSPVVAPTNQVTINAGSPIGAGQSETVTGHVSYGGVGLGGVPVTISDSLGGTPVSGTTDSNGNYAITWTAPTPSQTGNDTLTASSAGVGASTVVQVQVTSIPNIASATVTYIGNPPLPQNYTGVPMDAFQIDITGNNLPPYFTMAGLNRPDSLYTDAYAYAGYPESLRGGLVGYDSPIVCTPGRHGDMNCTGGGGGIGGSYYYSVLQWTSTEVIADISIENAVATFYNDASTGWVQWSFQFQTTAGASNIFTAVCQNAPLI